MHISPRSATSPLALRRPRRIYHKTLAVQKPPAACTGSTRSSVTSWARCRHSLVLQGSSYCPSHALRSLLPPPRLYSHHASSQRSANRDKLHLRWVSPSHLRESRSVWQEAEVAPHHNHRDLARAQIGVLKGACHCRAFPSRNDRLKLVRGTRGVPKCRLRAYHTRYCPAWSGTLWHLCSCW